MRYIVNPQSGTTTCVARVKGSQERNQIGKSCMENPKVETSN
jgi:hypothetical protein